MPDQAIQEMRQAVPSTDAPAWEVKLALDLGAAIVFIEADYERLSREAQEQALAKGYERGEPVMLGFTVERGKAPAFTLFGRDRVPNLELIRSTSNPRLAPEDAERMRALRKAMPAMTEGQLDWAKAEFQARQRPELLWYMNAEHVRTEQGPFGEEGVASRDHEGVGLLESRLIDDFAGGGAADWLRATLEEDSAALVHAHRLDFYYLRGRAAPDRMLRALEQWWREEASPAAAEQLIIAEPIEAGTAAPTEIAPSSEAQSSSETCWFCGGVADSAHASEVELYAPESVERSVEVVGAVDQYVATYQQLRVPVPRCERCRDAHDGETLRQVGGTLLGLIAGGGAAYLVYRQSAIWELAGPAAVWVGLAILVISGLVLGYRFGAARGRARRGDGVRPESANVEHPIVRQLLDDGYQLGKPEARAPDG